MDYPHFAAAILWNPKRKEVLLHLRDGNAKINPNKWAFFGGKVEEGETIVQGLIRELKEELDLVFSQTDAKLLCEYLNEELKTYRHVFVVECEKPIEQMMLGEGAGFEWIPIDRVFGYDLTKMTKDDLEFFLENSLSKK